MTALIELFLASGVGFVLGVELGKKLGRRERVPAFHRYCAMLEELYFTRSEKGLTMQEEYVFTCGLERIWAELTPTERRQVEVLTEWHKGAPRALRRHPDSGPVSPK